MYANLPGYLAFVTLGAILILIVGQLLIRSGQVYLEKTFDDPRLATSINRLIGGLFHLVMLGVLAIISTIEVPVHGSVQALITKLGVVLLVLGAGHGVTMLGLSRLRARRQEQELWNSVENRAGPPAGIDVVNRPT